jgi:hypothetical protein
MSWLDKVTKRAAENSVPRPKPAISPSQPYETPLYVCTSELFIQTGIAGLSEAVDLFVTHGLPVNQDGNAFIADRRGFVILGWDWSWMSDDPEWFGTEDGVKALEDSPYVHPLLKAAVRMELIG